MLILNEEVRTFMLRIQEDDCFGSTQLVPMSSTPTASNRPALFRRPNLTPRTISEFYEQRTSICAAPYGLMLKNLLSVQHIIQSIILTNAEFILRPSYGLSFYPHTVKAFSEQHVQDVNSVCADTVPTFINDLVETVDASCFSRVI
ncbi:hypothetical protein FOZ60_004266 [Perkinsus olseni]|uniref:Uncharacterized protein n=1 Tax=Perkinsus olseni TaxID=32597 RepID=A0A7J6NU92_PEROL|nr:hypothetical protein FOZ60_004266 [Perkinsus olseni]